MSRDYSKLPKWAQDEINLLRSNMLHITKKYEEAIGDTPSKLTLVDHINGTKGLPERNSVRFEFERGYIEFQFDVDRSMVVCHSDGGLRITPRASNSVHLEVSR